MFGHGDDYVTLPTVFRLTWESEWLPCSCEIFYYHEEDALAHQTRLHLAAATLGMKSVQTKVTKIDVL